PSSASSTRGRAEAEDALAAIMVEFDPLPAVVDMEAALDPATPAIPRRFRRNLAFERVLDARPGRGRGRAGRHHGRVRPAPRRRRH
ncbi:hypothetical protein CTI14_66440, partial [Methylobacterium radiotolerans]